MPSASVIVRVMGGGAAGDDEAAGTRGVCSLRGPLERGPIGRGGGGR
jgi:hypothetical protein